MNPVTLTFATPGPTALVVAALTRTDTGATVSGSVAQQSALVWALSITEPAAGLTYAYTLTGTWADGSTGPVSGTVRGTGVPAGMWGTFQQAIGYYSQDNLNQWSMSRDTGLPDLNMQQQAFNRADNAIISEIQKQYYMVPGPTGTLAADLAYIEAELFGVYLYEANGLQDSAKGMDGKMQGHRDNAMGQLQELLFYNRGGFTRVAGYNDAPAGVGATVDALGRNVGATPPFGRPVWNGSFWTWG